MQDFKKLVTALLLVALVVFVTSPNIVGEYQEAAVSSTGSYIQKTIGEQKVAVILVDGIHDGLEQSTDSLRSVFVDSPYSLNAYLQETSYGKTWITPDFFGWYDVRTLGLPDCSRPTFEQSLSFAANDSRDLKQYHRVVFIWRTNCPDEGAQNYGERTITTSDGTVTVGYVYYPTNRDLIADMRVDVSMAHEFVHNMGAEAHANAYRCGDKTLSSTLSECTQVHYGDRFDVLGHAGVHPNVCFKRAFGWIDSSNTGLRQITQSGTYRVYPQERAVSSGAKGLEIKLSKPIPLNQVARPDADALDSLFIEARAQIGKFTDFQTYDEYLNGVFIRGGQYGLYGDRLNVADQKDLQCMPTYLLDATPGSFDQFEDAVFSVGKSFYEPLNDVTITPKAVTADGGYDVEIIIGNSAVVDTKKPVVRILSLTNWSSVQRSTNKILSALATDNIGVEKVKFFVNGTVVCEDTTQTNSVYSCTWPVPSIPGVIYKVQAKAYDAKNNVGQSKTIYVVSR